MFARTSDILVRNIDYSIFFEKSTKRNRFTLVLRVRLAKTSIWAQIADFVPENPLENTFSRKLRNEPVLRFYEKKQALRPV